MRELGERELLRTLPSPIWKWSQEPELCQAEVSLPQALVCLPHGCKGSYTWAILDHLHTHQQGTRWEVEPGHEMLPQQAVAA